MTIEITSLVDNQLFGRRDVTFVIRHDAKTTPSRKEARELIAAEIGAKSDLVVVDHMDSETGMAATRGVARAYKDKKEAQRLERTHLLKRNGLYEEPKKKGEPKAKEAA